LFCAAKSLFDHFVGQRSQRRRERNADRLGDPEVEDQIELGRLLNRQIARFGAAQEAVNVRCKAPWPGCFFDVRSVSHQALGGKDRTVRYRRQPVLDHLPEERLWGIANEYAQLSDHTTVWLANASIARSNSTAFR
jgi:hypothetical protein